jgi:uncharacterized membrane protein YccC
MSPDSRIGFIVARCFAAALVFYAISSHPYNVYVLTRWVVFLTCAWGLWIHRRTMWPSFAPVYLLISLLFNPLFPFHFQRSTWRYLDVVTGVLIVLSLAFANAPRDSNQNKAP